MVRLFTRSDTASVENADSFLARLEAIRETVCREPGHVSYQLYGALEDQTVLFADEEWRTQAVADVRAARDRRRGRQRRAGAIRCAAAIRS